MRTFVAERKPCPFCDESISVNAKKCPRCREWLEAVWRDGKTLIMVKTATLPDRCVKSNQPAETQLKQHLSWHPGWIYVLAFMPFFYLIVALLNRKTATISIGLSDECDRNRRIAFVIAWSLAFAGIGIVIAGFAVLKGDNPMYTLCGGLVLTIGAAIYGIVAGSLVTTVKITDEHVWLNGVCEEYLNDLPEWDG